MRRRVLPGHPYAKAAPGQPGGRFRPFFLAERVAARVLVDLDGLVELQLPTLDEVATELRDGRVSVLVDRVVAEHARLTLGLVDLIDDRLAVVALVAGALHR